MAPPRVVAGVVAALLLAGRAADVAAQSHGSQQPSASLEDDVAILLAFQAVGANSQDRLVGTWAAGGGGPCDEASYYAWNAGWWGVMCCASYDVVRGRCTGANAGRVTYLDLYNRHGVSGDIGPLGRLAELRYLYLANTAVAGDVAALAALGQLQDLGLYNTAVWGRADALLRAIPGVGADWSLFTACARGNAQYTARFDQCPAGRSPVADGASYLGANECACCSGSLKMRDPTTGACVDPNDPCVRVDCGAHGICSGGTCFCESGYTGDRCTNGTDDATPVILLIVLVACSTVAALCWHKRKQLFSKNEAGEGVYDSTGAPPPANSSDTL